MNLERSDRPSPCGFSGEFGHLPRGVCLKDTRLGSAKAAVSNKALIKFCGALIITQKKKQKCSARL